MASPEETVEGTARDALLRARQGAGKLILKAGAKLGAALIAAGWRVATSPIRTAIENRKIGGEISEKALQATGEDIHQISLDNESLKAVGKSLRQSGITYAIEKGNDGTYFLHFQGKDTDHVEHAVRRAFDRIGLELNLDKPDETTPELGDKDEIPWAQELPSLNADDTPTGEIPAISADDTPTGEIPAVGPEPRVPDGSQRDQSTSRASDAARPLMPTGPQASDAMTTIAVTPPEWDPNAELAAESLDKLGVPYIQDHQNGKTTFTVPEDCGAAATQCIDAIGPSIEQVMTRTQTETPNRGATDTPNGPTDAIPAADAIPSAGQPTMPQTTDAPDEMVQPDHDYFPPTADQTNPLPFPTAGLSTDAQPPQTGAPDWLPDLQFPIEPVPQQPAAGQPAPDVVQPVQSAAQTDRRTTSPAADGTERRPGRTPAKERRDTGKGKPERGRKAKKTRKDFLDALKQKENKIRGQQGRGTHQRTRGTRPRGDKR